MADAFGALLRELEGLDAASLLQEAQQGLRDACSIFGAAQNGADPLQSAAAFLAAAVAVDGAFTAPELRLTEALFGEDRFLPILKTVDAQTLTETDLLPQTLSAEDRLLLSRFAACILVSDGQLDPAEYGYLERMMDGTEQ